MIQSKHLKLLFGLGLLFSITTKAQSTLYLDINGDTLSSKDFSQKLRSDDDPKSQWISKNNKGKEIRSLVNRYMIGKSSFKKIALELSKVTGKVISEDKTILIEYIYSNDMCYSNNRDNNWSKSEINKRKAFLKPVVKSIDTKQYLFIILFEKDIKLMNKPMNESEYFFTDSRGYFRDQIFKTPTICGSYAAIKPNGEILVRNGESRIDFFMKHLQPEYWNFFFPKE